MKQQEILGRLCKDKISQAEGVAVGVIDWMFGCRHYILRPVLDKDKVLDHVQDFFKTTEGCLEIVNPEPVVEVDITDEEPRFFGKICRDKVTGYEGMCIGRLWEVYSEKQYCLQAKYNAKKMKKAPVMWIDEGRVEVIESDLELEPKDVQSERKGGITDIKIPLSFCS